MKKFFLPVLVGLCGLAAFSFSNPSVNMSAGWTVSESGIFNFEMYLPLQETEYTAFTVPAGRTIIIQSVERATSYTAYPAEYLYGRITRADGSVAGIRLNTDRWADTIPIVMRAGDTLVIWQESPSSGFYVARLQGIVE